MKILLISGGAVLVALLLVALVVFLIGRTLPVAHTATVSFVVSGTPRAVWDRITNFAGQTEWRTGLKSVERQSDRDGLVVWKENGPGGDIELATVEAVPERRLVRRIVGEGLPFGGTWTTNLSAEGPGTRVTITEDGEVYNPMFRFVSRYVMGHETTLRAYERDLLKSFGDGPG